VYIYKKFKKILKKIKKIKIKIKKIKKKSRSDTWQSLFMAVNDLNGVSKKRSN